jgi:hypothetical protein
MSADFIGFRLDTIAFAGALQDPVAALAFCASQNVDFSVINGKFVVKEGHLLTVDVPMLVEHHNQISRSLINGD